MMALKRFSRYEGRQDVVFLMYSGSRLIVEGVMGCPGLIVIMVWPQMPCSRSSRPGHTGNWEGFDFRLRFHEDMLSLQTSRKMFE
jgi:hypothetical protein